MSGWPSGAPGLLGAAGIRLGIDSHGKPRGIVDYVAEDLHHAFEWLLRKA